MRATEAVLTKWTRIPRGFHLKSTYFTSRFIYRCHTDCHQICPRITNARILVLIPFVTFLYYILYHIYFVYEIEGIIKMFRLELSLWGYINKLMPNDTYMLKWTWSPSVQLMFCCLWSTKPLSEHVMTYAQFGGTETNLSGYGIRPQSFCSKKLFKSAAYEVWIILFPSQCVNTWVFIGFARW